MRSVGPTRRVGPARAAAQAHQSPNNLPAILPQTVPQPGIFLIFEDDGHSETDNDLDVLTTDFEDSSYIGRPGDLVRPNDAAGAYYDFDVTTQVLADLLNDGADNTTDDCSS